MEQQSKTNNPFSHDDFIKEINAVFQKTPQNQKTINFYSKYLIPFERSLKQKLVLAQSNSQIQNKIDILTKLQKSEIQLKQTQEILSETKTNLEIATIDRDRLETENKNLKTNLTNSQNNVVLLRTSLDQKLRTIGVSQNDKKQLVSQVENRSQQYNLLFESYMRDKNVIAAKLNQINEMEQKMLQRERRLEEDRFYLQNQRAKFEEQKKNMVQKPSLPDSKNNKKDINKLITLKQYEENLKNEQQVKSDSKKDIARQPIKKNIKHHSAQIYCLSSSYNGNILATSGGDRMIKFYDPLNLKTVSSVQSNSPQSIFVSLHLNYIGDKVIAGSTDKTVSIWDVNHAKQLNCFVGHGQKVNAVAFTNMKQKCVSGSNDRQLKVWDIQKGSNTLSVNCGKSVKVITPNYSEPIVYTGLADGSIRVYSINQGSNPMSQIKGIIDYSISSITLSSNRNQVLVGSQEGSSLYIMDLRTNKLLKKYEDNEFFNSNENFRADYSPSQKYILAGNTGGTIFYWNVQTEKRQAKLVGHQGTVTSVLYQPFTGIMSSTDTKGNLILWS